MRIDTMEYDLLVVGAGPGGLAAAITAAKRGLRVLLAERNGFLGGNLSSGSPLLGFFDKKGRRTVGGFGEQLVQRLVREGASEGHRICPQHHSVVTYAPDLAKLIYAKMCREAGVDILLHCEAIDAAVENERITSVMLHGRGMRVEVKAKMYIDTGDAELTEMSGAAYEKGRSPDGRMQPPSILYAIANYDEEKFLRYLEEHPEDHNQIYPMDYLRSSRNWCHVGLGGLWRRLNPIGEWPMQIWAAIMIKSPNQGFMYINGPRMGGADATDLVSITDAELRGQQQAADFLEVLRKHVAGFEHAVIANINPCIGVRETRRMLGLHYLTVEEAKAGLINEETIALSSYPIDIHNNDNTSYMIHLDGPFGVPYGCLVSKSIKNLLAAGKCISVDPDVFGSIRVMAQCMAFGEAAGNGAALAIRKGCTPGEVPVGEIRELLLQNGALLEVDENDVLYEPTLPGHEGPSTPAADKQG